MWSAWNTLFCRYFVLIPFFFWHCSLQFVWIKNTNVFAHDNQNATERYIGRLRPLALSKRLISRTTIKSGSILTSLYANSRSYCYLRRCSYFWTMWFLRKQNSRYQVSRIISTWDKATIRDNFGKKRFWRRIMKPSKKKNWGSHGSFAVASFWTLALENFLVKRILGKFLLRGNEFFRGDSGKYFSYLCILTPLTEYWSGRKF